MEQDTSAKVPPEARMEVPVPGETMEALEQLASRYGMPGGAAAAALFLLQREMENFQAYEARPGGNVVITEGGPDGAVITFSARDYFSIKGWNTKVFPLLRARLLGR